MLLREKSEESIFAFYIGKLMAKKQYYLRERQYEVGKNGIPVNRKLEFWKNEIGVELLNKFYQKTELIGYYKNYQWDIVTEMTLPQMKVYPTTETFQLVDEILFKNIQNFGYMYIKFLIAEYELFLNKIAEDICSNVFIKSLLQKMLSEMQSVSIRTLILEMHKKTQDCTDEDKYKFFTQTCLSDSAYTEYLLSEYPVLERCLWECVSRNVTFFSELVCHIKNDKIQIAQNILNGNGFSHIEEIESNLADAHASGKQVLKIRLDNGQKIIYKPHDIENEQWFGQFLGFLGQACGIEMYQPKMISRDGYGWVECIDQKECRSYAELERYYIRAGITLFAVYLLGTNDIHCENLIAMGEYPVVIDLESLAGGIHKKDKDNTVCRLRESVLNSGILPYFYWTGKGKGIDLSALAGGNGSETPFKVPVIKNPGTIDMHVGYEYAHIGKVQNHAMLGSEFISPEHFEKEIIYGFRKAYQYTLNHKELIREWIQGMRHKKGRYLVSDTQKYSMLLSSSYHPAVMRDAADREFLLYSLWRGRDLGSKQDEMIVDGEIYDLLRNDIPYFYFHMNRPHLYDSRGNEIPDYFSEPPINGVRRRLAFLCQHDLQHQERFIHLTLSLAGMENLEESDYADLRKMVEQPETFLNTELLCMAEKIADKLLDEAEYSEKGKRFNWIRIMLMGDGCGELAIRSCGMYVYDGIAGIFIFFYLLSRGSAKVKYKKVCEVLEKQLFSYTDIVSTEKKKLQSGSSGLYNGEASLVYTYLILFLMTRDNRYIEYSKKHAEVLLYVTERDKGCDLLEGKAGSVFVFCQMFLVTGRQEYLAYAKKTAQLLLDEAVEMVNGTAWKQKNSDTPLLGIAHGNAGILTALAKLYNLTGDDLYADYVKKTLEYEDYHYMYSTGNWKDFRINDSRNDTAENDTAAWCHGAGGIMLARILLDEMNLTDEIRENIHKDIRLASDYVQKKWQRGELCLCHGECGNLLMLRRYNKWKGKEERTYTNWKENMVLTKEWYQPGLMNGYTGIGYYLLLQIMDIPDFILMEDF